MLNKKNKKSSSSRSRQPLRRVDESFRRNNVIVSRSQREIAARQQSVTQRQFDRARHDRLQQFKQRFVAALVVIILLGLGWQMRLGDTKVTTRKPYTLSESQALVYQRYISTQINNNSIARQSWLLDTTALEQAIMHTYPEIENATFQWHTPFNTHLSATVTFRKPVFVWQDASKTTQFVDKDGVLFSNNHSSSIDLKKLVHIEDQSGVVLEAGSSVLTNSLIQFVGQLHTKLPQAYGNPNLAIERIIIPKTTREVQAKMVGIPYLVKFSSYRAVDDQTGELKTLLAYLKEKNITPQSYIDLRVAQKAFYK